MSEKNVYIATRQKKGMTHDNLILSVHKDLLTDEQRRELKERFGIEVWQVD
jgi:hypothetical protein